jgi:hypothetical protein
METKNISIDNNNNNNKINDEIKVLELESTIKEEMQSIQQNNYNNKKRSASESDEIIFLCSKKQKENETVYEYTRENPNIKIESGTIVNCKTISSVNLVEKNLNVIYTDFNDIFGSQLKNQLSKYNELKFVADESIYQIAITNHVPKNKYLHVLFNVCIDSYDYTSDKSEISFKSLIKNVLRLVDEIRCESISFPIIFWTDKSYPEYLLVKWFDQSINDYLNANTSHSIKTICVLLDDSRNDQECFKNYYLIEKPSLFLADKISLIGNYDSKDLNKNSNEYSAVSKHFHLTLPNTIIKRIVKVNNEFLKKHYSIHYSSLKEAFRLNNKKNSPLEYKLFHGTSYDIIEKICKKGFNRSYCGINGVSFGCGVYFAKESKYSQKYAKPNKKKEYCMILSRVLVGSYENGNPTMKEPNDQFDSTVDCIQSPTIFVVYNDFQAIPDYLIYYKFVQ